MSSNQTPVSKIIEANQATPEQLAALKFYEARFNSETQRDGKPYNNGKDDNTGGGNMSQYVTHEELNHVEDNLRHEIKETKIELNGSINDAKNELNSSISDLSGKIDKLSANIDTKFANQKVWLIATAVTVVSAGIGILSYIMNLMINH